MADHSAADFQFPRSLDEVRADYPDAPPHVPKDRIVDLNYSMGTVPTDEVDPYEPFAWLNGPDIPRLLYNIPSTEGLGGIAGGGTGNWIVTHYEDVDRVYTDNEHFGNKGAAEFQRLIGESFRSIPIAIDPPDHAKYRMFLMPHFSPSRITRDLEPRIRAIAVEMIEAVADKGEVDMAWDFGRVFPVRIFMGLMGFPDEEFEQFLEWEWNILHSGSLEKMQWALSSVLAYLRGFMEEKRKNPDEFLVSYIVNGEIKGEKLTDEEQIGMIWFLWLGGLDTVAATISQMYRRMALQPEIQRMLMADRSLINGAVEEFLRTQPILSSARNALKDFEWHGVQIKAGERVQCFNPGANFDPGRFDNPREFDPTRTGNRHFTFVGGIHACLGAHLARRELRVLLNEWFDRVGEFRMKEGADTAVFPGLLSIRNLPIVWDPK